MKVQYIDFSCEVVHLINKSQVFYNYLAEDLEKIQHCEIRFEIQQPQEMLDDFARDVVKETFKLMVVRREKKNIVLISNSAELNFHDKKL